jgi:putative hydrolase
VTRPPFGFGPSDRPDEPERPDDPFGLAGMLGGGADMGNVFGQLQRLMSWSGGPVNWDLATEVATTATRADDRPVTAEESAQVAEACRLADLWLDGVTDLPAAGGTGQAWSRTGWVEETLPAWRQLVDPVAGRVVDAMTRTLTQGLTEGLAAGGEIELPEGVPPEMAGMLRDMLAGGGLGDALGPLGGVMQQVGGFVFGAQVGQALGALAGGVLSSTDVGLPLTRGGRPALLPANVAAFAADLEVPDDQVRFYLALREAAHARLFAHVPWLQAHLFDAVDAYARGIEVDPAAIQRAVGEVDPTDPESLQRAVGEGLFDLPPTPAQQAALNRLETALALVEGWVDAVVDAAATGTLPAAAALRETLRRRRASGGPAEQTFSALVGLTLRPRRLRDAAALWGAVAARGGASARDALWAHPDLLPSAEDLDDPVGFAAGDRSAAAGEAPEGTPEGGFDWDAGLRDLDKDLDGSLDDDARGGPEEPPAPA